MKGWNQTQGYEYTSLDLSVHIPTPYSTLRARECLKEIKGKKIIVLMGSTFEKSNFDFGCRRHNHYVCYIRRNLLF